MVSWARVRAFWRTIVRRSDMEQSLSDEVRFHLERRASDLMARGGLSADDARRRVSTPNADLATALEREIRAVVPTASVSDSATLRSRLMQSVSDRSFSTLMVMFFAVAAMGVTAAGIVGVVAFVVARRTREVAIRIAIGANAASVRALVTREALAAAAVGVVIGFGLSLALSTTVRSLLVGIAPTDPLALGTAVIVIVAIVGVAAWIPARRATRLSPTVALRVE
ncbi:MAG TPA: FtsX-like permease family protein [Vicinamibacterales bacterium]|jgi:ABC-type lipoprotein release transport system permease subunit|nr:FtsX-like permease family protein [Vicinamibacterales bacterium]